ncbi:MAG: hypothetical protein ABIT71_10880 [Vicinamibacteraceae bacterium]
MSEERKYRQHGYRDDDRDRPKPDTPRPPREERQGPRTPNLMGSREVFRCGPCGRIQSAVIGLEDRCPQCAVDLHSCVQCQSFDPGSTFECMQAIPARVSPKDVRNTCPLFTARTTVERQTGSAPAAGPVSARQAFDDLFK